jgi:hypothetical protein
MCQQSGGLNWPKLTPDNSVKLYERYLEHARTDAQHSIYYVSAALCDGRGVVWSKAKEILFRLLNTDHETSRKFPLHRA